MIKKILFLMLIASPVLADTITIEIPDTVKGQYFDTFAALTNWQPTIVIPADPNVPDSVDQVVPNPITKKQNFKNTVAEMIQKTYLEYNLRVYKKSQIDSANENIRLEKERIELENKLP